MRKRPILFTIILWVVIILFIKSDYKFWEWQVQEKVIMGATLVILIIFAKALSFIDE